MSILYTIILSVVQGITEWLPISSDGHLVVVGTVFNIHNTLSFDIFLHLGSLVVILIFFRREIRDILRFQGTRHNWFWYIAAASTVTAAVGFWFYDKMDNLRTPDIAALGLFVTSAFLLASRFFKAKNKNISWQIALLLGLAQGLAVLPGLSRSGTVIALALIFGTNRRDAFDFAFILAIPAILGAFLLSIPDLEFSWLYILGFFVTGIISYLALGLLKKIINKNYFYLFFIYTFILALIIKLVL